MIGAVVAEVVVVGLQADCHEEVVQLSSEGTEVGWLATKGTEVFCSVFEPSD